MYVYVFLLILVIICVMMLHSCSDMMFCTCLLLNRTIRRTGLVYIAMDTFAANIMLRRL